MYHFIKDFALFIMLEIMKVYCNPSTVARLNQGSPVEL